MGDGRLPSWYAPTALAGAVQKAHLPANGNAVPSSTPPPKRAELKDRRIDRLTLWNNIDG